MLKNKKMPKILIVDDLIENIISLEKILVDVDVEIVRAFSAIEAISLVDEHKFALILMDVIMPNIDGFECADKIRENNKNKLIPIIFLSAMYKDDKDTEKFIESGVIDFIIKPIVPAILKGKVKNYLNVFDNEQELLKREKILYHTEKQSMISTMLAGMAHNLNNPLFSMGGSITLLERKGELSDYAKKHLKNISESLDRIVSISNSFFKMVKTDSKNIAIVNVQEVVDETLEYAMNLIKGKQIKIDVINKDKPSIQANRGDIRNVIINLLANSIESIEHEGLIEIIINSDAKNCYISIKDNGIGIKESEILKVFDPFYSTKEGIEDKGIGLTLVERIVKRHYGEVEITSKDGSGTTVKMSLPFDGVID